MKKKLQYYTGENEFNYVKLTENKPEFIKKLE